MNAILQLLPRASCPPRHLAFIAVMLLSGLGCNREKPPSSPMNTGDLTTPSSEKAQRRSEWPTTATAAWPAGCRIENITLHPFEPWLTAACSLEGDGGAILVFNWRTGAFVSSISQNQTVGWMENRGLLRWHPDGNRLATNMSTNGIAVFDRGRHVCTAYPDDTRDTGVNYLWIGDEIYSDTQELFSSTDCKQRQGPLGPDWHRYIEWNERIGAIVGVTTTDEIVAFAPRTKKQMYRSPVDPGQRNWWSSDGLWLATYLWPAVWDGKGRVSIVDGSTGKLLTSFTPKERLQLPWWNSNNAVALVEGAANSSPPNQVVQIVRQGKLASSIAVAPRKLHINGSIPEANGIAWSPSGDGLAFLLDKQEVRLLDAKTGKTLSHFLAPAPPNPDYVDRGPQWARPNIGALLWVSPNRIVRLGPHFVSFWSIDGTHIATFVMSGLS